MAKVWFPKRSGWILCQDPASPEWPWDVTSTQTAVGFQSGDVIAPPRSTALLGNYLNIGPYALYLKPGDATVLGAAASAAALGSATAPTTVGTNAADDTWNNTSVLLYLQNNWNGSTAGAVGKYLHLGTAGTSSTLTVQGSIYRPSIANKQFSAYEVDATYGSFGAPVDLRSGKIIFDPQGVAKAYGIQAGGGGTPIFDRVMIGDGSSVTFAETPTSTKYCQILCWSLDFGAGYISNLGHSSKVSVQCVPGQFGTEVQSAGARCWFNNTIVENSGQVRVGNGDSTTTTMSRASVWVKKLHVFSTLDASGYGLILAENGASAQGPDYTDANTKRVVEACAVEGTVVHQTSAAVGAANNGWDFIGQNRFGLYIGKFGNNIQNRTWDDVTRKAAPNQGHGIIPCATISREYLATARVGSGASAGNEKLYMTSDGTAATQVAAVTTWNDCYAEVADDTNTRGGDAGELLQLGNRTDGTWDTRDGWTFNRQRLIPAMDGTAFRLVEAAFRTGNTTQPPAAGTAQGQVTFNHSAGAIGAAAFGFAHQHLPGQPASPRTDAPGYDRIVVNDCVFFGANANATGATNPNFNNLTGPASICGLIQVDQTFSTADQACYTGAMDARSVQRCVFHNLRGSNPATQTPTAGVGSITYAPGAGWDVPQRTDVSTVDTGTKTEALLRANNFYRNPWAGRSTSTYLGALPGTRRIVSLGAASGITGTGTGSAQIDDQYNKTWRAMFAQDLASHPALPGAHAWYVAGVSTTALRPWVDADLVVFDEFLRGKAAADSTGNTDPGVVAMAAAAGGGSTVTGVSVSPSTAAVTVGGTTALSAAVAGSGSPSQSVTWTSSNPSIATVNSSGVVTGVALGSATITATSTQDGTKAGAATVTVQNVPTTVTGVLVSPIAPTGQIGGTRTLTAQVVGTGSPSQSVTWTSNNTAVATVDASGTVTLAGIGVAVITAQSTADASKSGSATVRVTAAGEVVLPPALRQRVIAAAVRHRGR